MGLGDLGQLGDIGGMIGSLLTVGIAAIVLLTFAPVVGGDIDGLALNSTARCEYQGEKFRWVLRVGTNTPEDGATAWEEYKNGTSGYAVKKIEASTACVASGANKGTGADAADYEDVYTPKGTKLTAGWRPAAGTTNGNTEGFSSKPEWKTANKSLTALSGGTIVSLLFQAAAIMIPAGAIGFLGYFGARFVAQNIGGGPLAVGIGATVAVVMAGALLPEVFTPLDRLYLAIDGDRYWVYGQGLGKIGEVIGNFLGISLLGGIVTLGMLLWKGVKGGSSAQAAM